MPFFCLCLLCPLACMSYRLVIFVVISDCQISIYKISQSLFGLLYFESWGLFVYILYLVRVSFQRQFNLLLCYINEFEGDLKRCRGTLCEVLADFKCYKELCSLHTVLLLPLYVYSIVANVTLNYLISESCLTKFPKSLNVQEHIMILSWSEISVAFVLYTFALGGFRVEYIWENFYENLLYLRSGNNSKFWEELLCGWKDLMKVSNAVKTSMIGSVIAIYLAFDFHDQSLAFLTNSCNSTSVTNSTCF